MSTPKRQPESSRTSLTPSKSGNLTGSRRVLNDTVVNIHFAVQSWKSSLEKSTINILAIQNLYSNSENQAKEDLVQQACQGLGDIVRIMQGIVQTLKRHSESLGSLMSLNKESPPPFFSWKYSDFYEMAIRIFHVFEVETNLRAQLATALGISIPNISELNYFATAWCHLVYAGSLFDLQFKAMLLEIGQSKQL